LIVKALKNSLVVVPRLSPATNRLALAVATLFA